MGTPAKGNHSLWLFCKSHLKRSLPGAQQGRGPGQQREERTAHPQGAQQPSGQGWGTRPGAIYWLSNRSG